MAVLTTAELHKAAPGQADLILAALKRQKVRTLDPHALVGRWIDVEGRGPGFVIACESARIFQISFYRMQRSFYMVQLLLLYH